MQATNLMRSPLVWLLPLVLLLVPDSTAGSAVRLVRHLSSHSDSSSAVKDVTMPANAVVVNVSAHPNLVTYPHHVGRKAKVDDSGSDEDMSQPTSRSFSGNSIDSLSPNTGPVAKASLDPSLGPQQQLPGSNNSTGKGQCSRPKRPHPGLLLKPSLKSYALHSVLVMQCHNGVTATAFCEVGGIWSRGPPHCPNTNQTCPELVIFNGNVTYIPQNPSVPSAPRSLSSKANFTCAKGFELVGAPMLICEKNFRWTYRTPVCRPVIAEQTSSSSSLLTALLVTIAVLLALVSVVSGSLWYYWWRRKRQREHWQRYFGNFTYRQSKHKFNNRPKSHNPHQPLHQEMKQFKATAAVLPSTEL